MTQKTSISWTDLSSNLIRAVHQATEKRGWGCVKISEGCKNCYAETINKRFGTGLPFNVQSLDKVTFEFNEKEADKLLKLKGSHKIFPCDMTDIFGEFVPDEIIDRVFNTFDLCRNQTFQVLTKRAERMYKYCDKSYFLMPDNIWLGVSVENNKQKDRIDYLLRTTAKTRFLSVEPLLENVDLSDVLDNGYESGGAEGWVSNIPELVIVGGESGRNARRCEIEWIRDIVQQCKEAGVKVWVKQLGSYLAKQLELKDFKGSDPSEWPEDIRIQEFPE